MTKFHLKANKSSSLTKCYGIITARTDGFPAKEAPSTPRFYSSENHKAFRKIKSITSQISERMNRESNLFPDATLNYDLSGSENQSTKQKTKQNKTSNSFSSAATTGFLNLKPSQKLYHFFPTPVDYQGGRKKNSKLRPGLYQKKELKLYPTKIPLHVLALFLK
jgi:hypothetical protein